MRFANQVEGSGAGQRAIRPGRVEQQSDVGQQRPAHRLRDPGHNVGAIFIYGADGGQGAGRLRGERHNRFGRRDRGNFGGLWGGGPERVKDVLIGNDH